MVRPEVTTGKSKIRCILDTMSSGRTFDSALVLPFLFLYLAFSSIISDRRGHFEEQCFLSKGNNVNVCDILKVGPSSIDFCPWDQVIRPCYHCCTWQRLFRYKVELPLQFDV